MRRARWFAIGGFLLAGVLVLALSKPSRLPREAERGATPPSAEAPRGLLLPRADQVQEVPNDRAEEGATTVNVYHRRSSASFPCSAYDSGQVCREEAHWRVSIASKECAPEAMRGLLEVEAHLAMEDEIDPQVAKRLSQRRVRVRADRMAPYGLAQKVIENCGLVGIYRVELGAAHPLKKAEGRIDTWLPRVPVHEEYVVVDRPAISRRERRETEPEILEKIRVAMWWDATTQTTTRTCGQHKITDDAQLRDLIKDSERTRKPDAPLIIDAAAGVPWGEVVNVINLAKRNGIDKIEYALGAK